jgi:ribose 5-phosphate isomerase B
VFGQKTMLSDDYRLVAGFASWSDGIMDNRIMQKETIYLASDHAGCTLKAAVCIHLAAAGYQIVDLGPDQGESVDYPDYGVKLAMALKDDTAARGIAICGSGIGISIAVNRFSWVRAALVSTAEAASLSRQHNDANVLALGERLIDRALALTCTEAFLGTAFEGGRHQRRVDKLAAIGNDR